MAKLESHLDIIFGTLGENIRITEVNGILDMQPRSPLIGTNSLFRGPGKGLPISAPEVVVNPVPTVPWPPVPQ